MTGGALPRQECQGAVTRSLKLAVLETQDVSMSSGINWFLSGRLLTLILMYLVVMGLVVAKEESSGTHQKC
jgi:hypothetical protein